MPAFAGVTGDGGKGGIYVLILFLIERIYFPTLIGMDTLPDQTYDEMLAAHVAAYGPEDPVEHGLVARIARAAFRLARVPELEERLLARFEAQADDADPAEELKALDLLARYEARLQMAAKRAQQELIVLRRLKGMALPAPLRPAQRRPANTAPSEPLGPRFRGGDEDMRPGDDGPDVDVPRSPTEPLGPRFRGGDEEVTPSSPLSR